MGEISDMILEGILCQECGGFVGEACGYPRTCDDCLSTNNENGDENE